MLRDGVATGDNDLDPQMQRRYVSQNEFAEAAMAVVEEWSRGEVVAIFKQGQENLARKHEKEGIVVSRYVCCAGICGLLCFVFIFNDGWCCVLSCCFCVSVVSWLCGMMAAGNV